jgi:hypothetical protein
MIRRPARFFAIVLVLALAAAGAERAVRSLRGHGETGRGARWIWAADLAGSGEAVAFYAARDVELARSPAAARLAIAADESYALYVNGRHVGSGSYRHGAPLDLYDVTADLDAGWNRLTVRLASSDGAGGLLANLTVDGEASAATDASWRVFRGYESALLRGWPLGAGEAPALWQLHPTGRWRLAPPAPRPSLPVEFPGPVEARARRARSQWDDSPWVDLERFRDAFPQLGARLVVDWGEEVTGVLTLDLATDDGEAGLLWVGSQPPVPAPPADAVVIPVPGRGEWVDVHARRFRYAYLAGVALARPPAVRVLPPELAAALAVPERTHPGVFGITPPRPDTLAEEKVRRRLDTSPASR